MALILVAEDDSSVNKILDRYLKRGGHRILHTTSVKETFAHLQRHLNIDLILLDRGLTDGDGIKVCQQLKKNHRTRSIPVIIMTGLTTFDEEIRSYEAGADLYVAKPLDFYRLGDYVAALLKRSAQEKTKGGVLSWDAITIDPGNHAVTTPDGTLWNLPTKQFGVLYLLISYQGRLVSRFTLIKKLWRNAVRDREVDVTVCRLRKRLGRLGREIIEHVPGQGYRLKPRICIPAPIA